MDEAQARKRRKQEGAVYTPAFITRYIVGQALGGVLKQRFEALRQQHDAEAAGTARKPLADPNAYDLAALNEPQRKALIRFWEARQEALKCLRILDPACGSGAFLIETFDQLHALYETSNARLEELPGQRTLFDLDRQILQHNLYGVDLNAESMLQFRERPLHGEAEAERLLARGLAALGLAEVQLAETGKGAWEKEVLAWWLCQHTTARRCWVSERLGMGDEARVTKGLGRLKRKGPPELERLKRRLEQVYENHNGEVEL